MLEETLIEESIVKEEQLLDHIVIDVEIQNPIDSLPNRWDDTHLMGIGCAIVYEYLGNRFRVYGPDDINDLKERLLIADRISGFNIWKFDYQVIFQQPGHVRIEQLREKTNDLLIRVWRSLGLRTDMFTGAHKGWSLENVARGTLGRGKSGNGADAPLWYQAGRMHKLIDYCLDDVTLERDLTDHIDKFGFVNHPIKGMVQINKELTTP